MAPSVSSTSDGFDNDPPFELGSTLSLDNNISLKLSLKSLIIQENAASEPHNESVVSTSCQSVTIDTSAYSKSNSTTTLHAISLYNILWAELCGLNLKIFYAHETSKTAVSPEVLTYTVKKANQANLWISKLLEQAYRKSQQQKRLRVLVNPKSGKGDAANIYAREVKPIFVAAHCHIDMTKTQYGGEAADIAKVLDVQSYDTIVACSGDGIPHEIFNGLGQRPDAKRALSKIAVTQVPCGSGNGMSSNLAGNGISASMVALAIVKGIRTPLDLISITHGDTRILSFLTQAAGNIAELDLATEHLRWMGGSIRFAYGYLVRIMQKKKYPCDLAIKVEIQDKDAIKDHYRFEADNRKITSDDCERESGFDNDEGLPALKYGTVNDELPEGWKKLSCDTLGTFYSGNMAYVATDANAFATALPNDGCMDLFTVDADISRTQSLKLMLALADGSFFNLPYVNYCKVLAYRLTPRNQNDGYISIDGEGIPFGPFQAEVHKGLGTVLSKTGHIYESPGPL